MSYNKNMSNRKQFYHTVVQTDSITVILSEMDLSDQERVHLSHIMESSLHHAILDAILSELSATDKKLFLKELANDDHDAVWKFLKDKIDGIEDRIVKVSDDLKKELHEDVKKVKNDKEKN